MWFRPGIHRFSENLIFLRYGQIRPQLGRLLGIEFVGFHDLLIEDVRIAVAVSILAWLNAFCTVFRFPVSRRSFVARPRRQSRNRKSSTVAFALMRFHRVSRPLYLMPVSLLRYFDPSPSPLYDPYPIGPAPPW